MIISLQVTEKDIKQMVLRYIEDKLNITIEENDLKFEVKSSQNYRAEWEEGQFRVTAKRVDE